AMNAAVQLFINDPGACRPKEQMTDSDWWLLVKGISSKQSTSQEVYRLYMQVAAGSFVEQGKVELAVLTQTSTRELNYLTQGSRASGIPAPPTQETFTRLLSLTDTWASLTGILDESLAMEQLP
ncbi:GABBR2, partial [Symbiodinium necroappetens]